MTKEKPAGLIQGTLEMLILKTLDLQSLHAFGIGQRIEQISGQVFKVNPGSLFPALARLQRAGLLRGDWRETENKRRAKYYSLTSQGRAKLKSETREWGRQTAAIARILEESS